MKAARPHEHGKRERQIMDVLYRQGRAAAADVQTALPDPPSYSAVRAMLRILEAKGHVRHEQDGPDVTSTFRPWDVTRRNAQRFVICSKRFSKGSTEQAVTALLDDSGARSLRTGEQLIRLARLIEQDEEKEGCYIVARPF